MAGGYAHNSINRSGISLHVIVNVDDCVFDSRPVKRGVRQHAGSD